MKPNEKAVALESYDLNTNLKRESTMNTIPQNKPQFQFNSRRELLESAKLSRLPQRQPFVLPELPFLETTAFVCDECAAPLHLYGENFIDSYSDGQACILRSLCDLHAEELEVNAK